LRSLSLGTNIIPITESNTLIVTDYSYRMAKIEEILKFLDVQGAPKKFAHRQLEYMQAAVLIPRLQALAVQLENMSITVGSSTTPTPAMPARIDPRTGQPGPGGPLPSMPASSSGSVTQNQIYLDADERTNRVLMIGTEEQLKTVNKLIDTLDVRQHFLRYVKEYEIKNVDASEVINVLNELGLATVSMTQSTDQPIRQAVPQPARPGVPAARPATPQGTAAQASSVDQPSISIRPNTNSLLVNATIEQHEDIELVIKHIDVEQKDQRTIEEYEIQNVDAKEIVQTLGDLAIISKDSVSNITTSKSSMYDSASSSRMGRGGRAGYPQQTPYPQPGMGQTPQPEQSAVVSLPTAGGETIRELITTEPQISILETTNSLLIYATPRQHASVALVIAHVDRELSETTAPYVVYPLENQDPEELADTLTSLIEGTIKKAKASGGATPGMGATPDARIRTESIESVLPKKEEERITIISDPKSYSLIVYANKKNQQWIATLIKQLDEYRPQVLLDCTLVEVTKQDDFNYDLNIIHSIPDLTNTSGLTGTIVPGTPPITSDDILTKLLAPTSDRSQFIDMQSDSGQFTGFYGNDKVMALFTAMQTKKYGRVLANPKILVDDNQEGNIETKNTTYIERTTSTNIPAEGGQIVTTQDTKFEPYDAKINLKIKPHISKGNNLRLEIEMIRSDFVDYNKLSPKPPNQAESNVKTVVTVPDNSTIILGGMDKINQSKGGTKVPLLGDIPFVGGLFRSTDNTSTESKLYIFVKPHILRPGEDLSNADVKRISNKNRKEFEEKETEMQKYQDWPGLDAQPMDPVKVLDDEDESVETIKNPQSQNHVITVPVN
jgi:general secretion pathway protein D